MTQGQADDHLAVMAAIVCTLERLASDQPTLFDAPEGREKESHDV